MTTPKIDAFGTDLSKPIEPLKEHPRVTREHELALIGRYVSKLNHMAETYGASPEKLYAAMATPRDARWKEAADAVKARYDARAFPGPTVGRDRDACVDNYASCSFMSIENDTTAKSPVASISTSAIGEGDDLRLSQAREMPYSIALKLGIDGRMLDLALASDQYITLESGDLREMIRITDDRGHVAVIGLVDPRATEAMFVYRTDESGRSTAFFVGDAKMPGIYTEVGSNFVFDAPDPGEFKSDWYEDFDAEYERRDDLCCAVYAVIRRAAAAGLPHPHAWGLGHAAWLTGDRGHIRVLTHGHSEGQLIFEITPPDRTQHVAAYVKVDDNAGLLRETNRLIEAWRIAR